MSRRVIMLGVTLLMFGCLALAADKSTVTGVVSDSHCGAKHSTASDAATGCVKGCVKGGASYVLVTSDGKVYQVNEQDKFAQYAGKEVKVTGTVNGESISVDSVEGAS
jgi:hypothetical protein